MRVCRPVLHFAGVACDDQCQIVVLVDIRFGMLVHEKQAGVVQQRPFAFRRRLHAAHQIGELLHVPAADVPQDAHATRRLHLAVRVLVMPLARVAEPWKSRESLAFCEHVGGDACLSGSQRVHQQVALQFRDPRPVLQVAPFGRPLDHGLVFGRQARDRSLQVAHRGQIFIQSRSILRCPAAT